METAERNTRVVELLTRKDAIVDERVSLDEQLGTLAEEAQKIDDELADLMGMKPEPNGNKKQMTCSICGAKGHNKKGCPQKGAS